MKYGAMEGVIQASGDADWFAKAKQVGVDGLEINLKIAHLRDGNHPRLHDLKKLSADTGVAIASTCLGEHNGGGIATWWRGSDADDEVRLALEYTRALGAPLMLLPFFFFNEPKGKTHRRSVAERLKPLAGFAAKLGVTIAYEGVMPAPAMLELLNAVNSPCLGVYYDVANATWCDFDPAAEVRLLGKHVKQIHIKEAAIFTGDARPGQGRVDWPAYCDALLDIAYNGWAVLETPAAGVEIVRQDVAFARNLFRQD